MLGLLTEKLPDDALERLADPTALRTVGTTLDKDGRRCWIGHAADWEEFGSLIMEMPDMGGAASYFDNLCDRFGVPRISRACRLRAERVLSSRGLVPKEPRGAVVGERVEA